MNNYEYIIASLPVLDSGNHKDIDAEALVGEILSQCSDSDRELVNLLLSGFDPDRLDRDFYVRALAHRNRFVREYFRADLNIRNAKVEYLNKTLGRPEGKDVILLEEDGTTDFEDRPVIDSILYGNDILARERGLDDYLWKKIEEINELELFSIDVVLGFAARLKIVDRWLKLDPDLGRELFHRLINEIKER